MTINTWSRLEETRPQNMTREKHTKAISPRETGKSEPL